MIAKIVILYLLRSTMCIPLGDFYGFGFDTPESSQRLGKSNDVTSGEIDTNQYYYFYGKEVTVMTVSVDGTIFFGAGTQTEYSRLSFPQALGRSFVAPFMADVDTTGTGTVWYRQSTDEALLAKANMQIQQAFPLQPQFTATNLFIATWDQVGFYDSHTHLTNTFQCVLATNGPPAKETYAIYLYADGEINWTTGDLDGGNTTGLGGNPAMVGVNRGDGIDSTEIPISGTPDVINIASTSNVGVDGLYVIKISDVTVDVATTCKNMITGIEHLIGEVFQQGCDTRCTCRAGGQTDCITVPCDFDGPTCKTAGDPHYFTFDGFRHDYQGGCQYIHVERCTNSEFAIKTRNSPCPNPQWTCVTEVTIEVPMVTIVLAKGDPIPVIINGQTSSTTANVLYNANDVEVKRNGATSVTVFAYAIGFRVTWNPVEYNHRVDVTVSKLLLNELCGLCGTYNGNANDDMQKRNGTQGTSLNDFGDSWLVAGSCTIVEEINVQDECTTNQTIIQEGQERCAVLMGEVFSSCNSVVNASQYIESCEYDYRCCGGENREGCYCDNLASYATACAEASISISTWRNSFCPLECPTGMVYQQCGSFCPPTCDDINATATCQGGCVEGCFCPDGQVLLDGECVDPFVCTACNYTGVLYGEGTQIQPNCTSRCTCQNGEFQCEEQTCFADGPTCYAYGDPHYLTFDLQHYNFQGDCEYVLTTPCDNDEFTVVVGNVAKSTISSSMQLVRISVPGARLEIVLESGKGGTVTINGVSHLDTGDGSVMLSGGVEVVRSGGHPHVLLGAQGIRVFWDGVNRAEVTVSTSWQGKLCGLCGNYNNNDADEYLGPDGQLFSDVNEFVSSWTFNNTLSCGILPEAGECLRSNRNTASIRCSVLQDAVFSPCHDTVDPQPFINNCIDDYCIFCDDADKGDCLCNSLATYASVCAAAGIVLQNWRDSYCSIQCPAGMLFQQCGKLCPQVCDASATCDGGCAEGCFCPTGQVVDSNGQCVQPQVCGSSGGNDPHFLLPLHNGDSLCFSIQGEPDFIFSLIKDKYIEMNAQFVLPAEDESHTISNVSTFLGSFGLLLRNPSTAKTVIIKVLAQNHSVSVDNSITTVKDRPVTVTVGDDYVTVNVDQRKQADDRKDGSSWLYINTNFDFGLKVRFYKKHLEMFLVNTGVLTEKAHGLIGQFLTSDVFVDTENMLMKFSNHKPISIKKGLAWPYLKIDKDCWYGAATNNQGAGMIDGVYTDYIVDSLIPYENEN